MTTPDEEAFTVLFNAHYLPVLRFVRRRVGLDQADDIVSETFLVAWRRFGDIPRDQAKPWLFGVAYNVMSRNQRGTGRQQALRLRIAAQPGPDQALLDIDVSYRVDLSRAWAHLNDQDQEALALIAWDGLSSVDAAAVLGCSRSAFSVRLMRARRRLRSHLDHPSASAMVAAPQISTETPSSTELSETLFGDPR